MRVEADEGIEFVARNETGAGVVCEGRYASCGPGGEGEKAEGMEKAVGEGRSCVFWARRFWSQALWSYPKAMRVEFEEMYDAKEGIGGGQLGYTCSSCFSTVGVPPISRKSSMRARAPRRVISAAHTKRGVSTNARTLSAWRRKGYALDEACRPNFLTRIEMGRPCVALRPAGSPSLHLEVSQEKRRGASLSWHTPSRWAFMPILMQKAGLRPPELRPSDGGLSSILCRRALRVGMRRRPRRGPAFPRLQPLHRCGACRCPRCWWIRRLPRRCWPC